MNNIYQHPAGEAKSWGGKALDSEAPLQQRHLSDTWHKLECEKLWRRTTAGDVERQHEKIKRRVQHMCEQINCCGNYDHYRFLLLWRQKPHHQEEHDKNAAKLNKVQLIRSWWCGQQRDTMRLCVKYVLCHNGLGYAKEHIFIFKSIFLKNISICLLHCKEYQLKIILKDQILLSEMTDISFFK